jgi:hypothetical protein
VPFLPKARKIPKKGEPQTSGNSGGESSLRIPFSTIFSFPLYQAWFFECCSSLNAALPFFASLFGISPLRFKISREILLSLTHRDM